MTRPLKDYADILQKHAATRGRHPALFFENEQISYALLEENVNRSGNMLKSLGLCPGDRLLLALPDCPDAFYAFLGAMKCGVCPVLLSPGLSRESYAYILRDATPAALLTTGASAALKAGAGSRLITLCIDDPHYADLRAKASGSLVSSPPSADGVDFLLYSSGSTGVPKGVPHSQGQMLFCAEQYAGQVLGMSADDICFSAGNLHFAYGLGNSLIFPLYFGASTVLNPRSSGPADIFYLLQLMAERRPTLFFAVPTLYQMLVKTMDEATAFSSVRLCVSAGEALPQGLYHQWLHLTGLPLLDGIGSTESLHIFISNRPGLTLPGRTGFVVPGYEARIIGEDGLPQPSGHPGSLLIRGKSTAPFYWNQPEKTAKTMRDDGWLDTGDVFIEEEGCYAYQGRRDDLFKSGGNWVSPHRIEQVLGQHPAVRECAVTSRSVDGLQKPVAFVVIQPGYESETGLPRRMRSFILEQLPAYLCPAQFIFTEMIPRTETGKIKRSALVDTSTIGKRP